MKLARDQGVQLTPEMLKSLAGRGTGVRSDLPSDQARPQVVGTKSKTVGWEDPSLGQRDQGDPRDAGQTPTEGGEAPEGPAPVPDDVGDRESVSGDKGSSIESFRRAVRAIFELCPESVPPTPSDPSSRAYGFEGMFCLLYTSPSPRDGLLSRMPSSA